MDDLWREVAAHRAEEQGAQWVDEMQALSSAKRYAEVMARFMAGAVDNDPPGFAGAGPLSEAAALEWALRQAAWLNPDGWADDPGDDETRRGIVMAAYREWRARCWDAWEWGDGRDKGPNPYRGT